MSKQVLIVDDNEDVRDIYQSISSDELSITTVPNGNDALKLVEENPKFDAVLLDLSMPILDGLTVAQEIRRNEQTHTARKPIHLAFFTARVIDDIVERIASETKVERIFKKPCDPFVLVEKVKNWLNESHSTPPPRFRQTGSSNAYFTLCLIAVIVQIITVGIFWWLLNKQDVIAAYQFTAMKSQRDQVKQVCDSNLEKKDALEKWIEQNTQQKPPPELFTERQCAAIGEK